jgi:pimeloyl-ACP methyl ester carboxylesterase
MLRPFFTSYRVVSLPPRALWGDGAPPPTLGAPDWRQLADDLLAGLARYDLPPVIAVGHSFGGVASALAVIRQPQNFRALVLLDPTFLPEQVLQGILQLKQMGIPEQHPLAQAALKRKRDFDSPDELYLRYRTRPTFADWTEEALRLYAEHGTTPKPEGGVTLAWSPEWEAFYFSSGYTETWAELPALDGKVPTLVIQGATSDTFTPESYEKARTLLPSATFKQVAGHGHLFPQSAPDQAAALIRAWLDEVL